MALRKDITYKGLTVASAYITVVRPTISGDKLRVGFGVQACASPDDPEPFTDEHFLAPYSLEGSNPFEQAYEYLKTLPEFSGAKDC